MSHFNERRQYDQVVHEREYPTPAPVARQSASGMVTLGLSIFAGIMFVSLFFSGINVAITVVSTAVVYGGIITLVLLIDSGTLAYWLGKRSEERTRREEMHLAYGYHNQRISVVEGVQPGYELPAPAQPQLPASRFVPATPPADEALKLACYQFVRALFDEGGRPLPQKILGEHTKSPGLVQYEKPKRDVVEYLLGLQMVWENERKQLFFNVARYPTLRKCISAIKIGSPAGSEGVPPIPSPLPLPLDSEVSA